jgi:hypothetical protein
MDAMRADFLTELNDGTGIMQERSKRVRVCFQLETYRKGQAEQMKMLCGEVNLMNLLTELWALDRLSR